MSSEKEEGGGYYKWMLWSIEILFIAAIIGVGWFLIGYYTQYEFLETGYQDWIYHAFRIRDIAQYGITSWDHIWGNGLNHWRAFQYIEHVLTYEVVKLTGWSITHAMLWISVVVFIGLRVAIYVILRRLGINRLISLFSVIISYTFSQQWIALKDYSIFIGFIVVPFFTMLWIGTLNNRRYIYLLAAVAGSLWSVHPVVGYSASGMFFFLLFADNYKQNLKSLVISVVVFFLSSTPFTFPYFFSGYSLSNPIFATRQFLQDTIISEYFGLNLAYFILIGFSWIVMIWKSNECSRWAKLLLVYCTAYIIFIYFGQLGYYPTFINKFQFSRAIPFIAIILIFCFASFLQVVFTSLRSRMIFTVFLVLIVTAISQSIDIASLYTAQPVTMMQDPVNTYFSGKDDPKGSIYFKNGVESSYFNRSGLRFITSYNQHMLPNPYPMRFDGLMKTDISYTGVTDNQIRLIDDYSLVLGVEYLFIPSLSPLVDGLTINHEDRKAAFENVGEVNTGTELFTVLRNTQPIGSAYVFEEKEIDALLRFSNIPKPTLQIVSYKPWDEEVSRIASLIREKKFQELPISFEWPDKLVVKSDSLVSFHDPGILITQSYDKGWVTNESNIVIEPTNLRFMHLIFSDGRYTEKSIHLQNYWPWWHWPVQCFGVIMVILATLGIFFSRKREGTL